MAKNSTEAIEALAAELGEALYLDVAKWHLYLNDAHLHTPLAEQLLPLLEQGPIQEQTILGVLQAFKVKVGGGRHEISLLELLPVSCQMTLIDLLEAFQRQL